MSLIDRFVRCNRKYCTDLSNRFPRFFYAPNYYEQFKNQVQLSLDRGKHNVLEVGGIDRPLLRKDRHFTYTGLDIEYRATCGDVYDEFLVQSIEVAVPRKFDMIVSITLLEHVRDNTKSVRTIYNCLSPGGVTHHYVPSKWHPYSVLLRVLGPGLQKLVIAKLRPHARDVSGYPAYFDYCSPGAMRDLFLRMGFINVKVEAFFRANDYFSFFVPAFILITLYENVCRALRLDVLASGFIITAEFGEFQCTTDDDISLRGSAAATR